MVPDGPCSFHLATASPNLASLCRPPASVSPPPSPGSAAGSGTGPGLSSHFITAYTKTSFFWWAACGAALCSTLYCASSIFDLGLLEQSPLPLHPSSFFTPLPTNIATVAQPSRSRSGDSNALYQSPASTADLTKPTSKPRRESEAAEPWLM
ncbi:hypothetical protein CDV36_005837 [Fusarium kuroshium]|uniref:Uncharacterized protein n=2 Tax=Fusarium solani species complex TaxID=232080 RepID=A0A3M2SA83_9HYPO|nr:hypothetical protein CDV36_005837 [Fusarium kuroshium]RSM19018.1 hypothetical protein CDV31_002149 [Fusarium ambrosium]